MMTQMKLTNLQIAIFAVLGLLLGCTLIVAARPDTMDYEFSVDEKSKMSRKAPSLVEIIIEAIKCLLIMRLVAAIFVMWVNRNRNRSTIDNPQHHVAADPLPHSHPYPVVTSTSERLDFHRLYLRIRREYEEFESEFQSYTNNLQEASVKIMEAMGMSASGARIRRSNRGRDGKTIEEIVENTVTTYGFRMSDSIRAIIQSDVNEVNFDVVMSNLQAALSQ